MNPVVIPQYYGDAGTFQALEIMRRQVQDSYLHPWIRERAASIVRLCNGNHRAEEQALCDFVRNSICYVKDPNDTEVLADPISFIEARLRQGELVFGDCAQMVPYLATLLKSCGHNPKFKVIGSDESFHHVFIDCEGAELDPTMERFSLPDLYDRYMLIET